MTRPIAFSRTLIALLISSCATMILSDASAQQRRGDAPAASPSPHASCTGGEMSACAVMTDKDLARGSKEELLAREKHAEFLAQCDKKDAAACVAVGNNIFYGRGGIVPKPKAAEYYLRGCDGGDMLGCNNLGNLYLGGFGVKQDVSRATALYKRACDSGEPDGCLNLGVVLVNPKDKKRYDPNQGLQVLARACKLGQMSGCHLAGVLGLGDEAEGQVTLAVERLRTACTGGVAESCMTLGNVYGKEDLGPTDLERSKQFFGRACDLGKADACIFLGKIHLGKDRERAHSYYMKACALGTATSCTVAGLDFQEGSGTTRDLKKANALFEKSCAQKEPEGCHQLANNLLVGKGITKDRARAVSLFGRACSGELEAACDALAALCKADDLDACALVKAKSP